MCSPSPSRRWSAELETATDPSEHRELTEQIRRLTAHIDRMIGALPSHG